MKDNKVKRIRQKIVMFSRQFLQDDTGIFAQALGDQEVAAVANELVMPHRERIYSPLDTLRLFVGQVLSPDRACQDVVGRRLSERVAQGQSVSALNTGSYCDARQRLPIKLAQTLGARLGNQMELMAPSAWRWQGRPVKLFDGTTVSMPDTPSNSQAYPQSSEQKPGLGFPLARIGALISLSSGAILGYQVAGHGKGSFACGRIATCIELYRCQASVECILRSASSNIWRANSHPDRDRDSQHRDTAFAEPAGQNRASREETTTQESSVVNHATTSCARPHLCSPIA